MPQRSQISFVAQRCLHTALLLLLTLTASAQPEWHLKKEEAGIKVFTKSAPNSNFKMVRVEFTINAHLAQIAAFLQDVGKQQKWIYNSENSKLVKRVSSSEIIYYSVIDLTWPCTNRDYISHVWMKQASPQVLVVD